MACTCPSELWRLPLTRSRRRPCPAHISYLVKQDETRFSFEPQMVFDDIALSSRRGLHVLHATSYAGESTTSVEQVSLGKLSQMIKLLSRADHKLELIDARCFCHPDVCVPLLASMHMMPVVCMGSDGSRVRVCPAF